MDNVTEFRCEAGHEVIRQNASRVRGGLRAAAVERVHKLIHKRLGDKLSLQDMADAACVSRFHFARSFRQTIGDSPMAYWTRFRIEQSKDLLIRKQRMAEIAATLGFVDESHFSRTFRRLVGLSPREYVRSHFDVTAASSSGSA